MPSHERDHIQIDELKICYTAETDNLNEFFNTEIGTHLEIHGYRFHRIVSDRFRYYFEVWNSDEQVAQLKFGLYTDLSTTRHFVYFKVNNHVLYKPNQLKTILELPNVLGLVFNNYTSIDLAIDSNVNFTSLIKRMMRDKAVTTIINGKAIKDRKQVLQGVGFNYSTSLDRLKHAAITIKQKKAISNKQHGITIQAYDKKAEIEQNSDKRYILDFYGHPKRLYRLEVRLHYQELKDYFSKVNGEPIFETMSNQELLQDMFYYHLAAVLRFTQGRKKIDWPTLIKCNGRI
jgi:predicted RND superfamily exporter protein